MSHTVTVRTTTTTTSSGYVHFGVLRTVPGILKLLETVVGCVVLGITAYYGTHRGDHRLSVVEFEASSVHTYLFLVSFGCLLATFLLLVSSLGSLISSTLVPKTLFELLFHIFAFILYLSAGLALLIVVTKDRKYYKSHEALYAAAALGLLNAIFYAISAVYSYKAFRSE